MTDASRRGRANLLGVLLLAACLAGAAWLVLRQPAWREAILSVAPYREATRQALERRLLAPRSVFIAGAVCGTLALGLCAWRRTRIQMLCPLAWREAAVALLVALQLVAAVAVVFNVHASYYRIFGKPVGMIGEDEVLSFCFPQSWPDSKRLGAMLPADARVALFVQNEALFYQLPSMCYPTAFYEPLVASWSAKDGDPRFARHVRDHGLTHALRYSLDRASPFELVKVP